MNRLWLSEYVKENKSIRQEMTAKQKDPEVAKSLAQASSEQNLEHLIQIKSLSEDKLLLHETFAESGKTSQPIKDSTKSEQSQVIRTSPCTGPCTIRENRSIKLSGVAIQGTNSRFEGNG